MINWSNVLFNGSWILGSSILLAAFSFYYWQATEQRSSFKSQLETNSFQRLFNISLIFICIGLAGTSHQWWETLLWVIFALINIYQTVTTLHSKGLE